jgi:IK cytokine
MLIFRAVFKSKPPDRNEHFLPGRMAYLIELEDEMETEDIPTTVLRSKADCPGMESQATLSTNDIVINKLTQILSYLRQGGKHGKKVKKTKEKEMPPPLAIPTLKNHLAKPEEDSIYGNIGDYVPGSSRDRNKDIRNDKRHYFDEKNKEKERDDKEQSKDKSSAVLEAERTLGALLKPGGTDDYKVE